jgi:N-terminal acetyltransferase B complex non-catalytic subunit
VVKDVEAIDLLEWASGELAEENAFAETLGPLRVRLVKAAPKDKIAATKCLESCLLHWDLVSAQQVCHSGSRDWMRC